MVLVLVWAETKKPCSSFGEQGLEIGKKFWILPARSRVCWGIDAAELPDFRDAISPQHGCHYP
jgi:hypothetical protein